MPKTKCIMVPVDFSPRSEEALEYAIDLAKPWKAKLVLMHAIEPMVFPTNPTSKSSANNGHGEWRKTVDGNLSKLTASVKKRGRIPVSTLVKTGRAFHEIARGAKAVDADLIVMGSEGYSANAYALLGSTAERVARRATCPVLLVRKKGQKLS